jgi:curved DNA-binding protein CbpA
MAGTPVMDAWRILEIPAGSDVGTIKRAYAAKIKRHRPDEAPAEFQRIHQAYKSLLAQVSLQSRQQTLGGPSKQQRDELAGATQSSPEHGSSTTTASVQRTSEVQRKGPSPVDGSAGASSDTYVKPDHPTLSVTLDQEYQTAFDELKRQIEINFASQLKLHDITNWQFLRQSHWMLDGKFNRQLSEVLFMRLVAYYAKPLTIRRAGSRSRKRYGPPPLSYNLLILFDQLFNWQGQKTKLLRIVDRGKAEQIFAQLDAGPDDKPLVKAKGITKPLKPKERLAPVEEPSLARGLMMGFAVLVFLVQLLKALATN